MDFFHVLSSFDSYDFYATSRDTTRLKTLERSIVMGIAGGTGSGKTTVAKKIAAFFRPDEVVMLDQDSYYRDLSDIPFEERKLFNFDHPDAFDSELLSEHLDLLRQGQKIAKPVYSYATHCRTEETVTVEPAPVILLEGILILDDSRLRELMDIKIFVDTDDDIRLIRRLRRDIHERGRDLQGVLEQYERTVRPMHLGFVLPTKRYADVVIPRGGNNDIAIRMVVAALSEQLRHHGLDDAPPFLPLNRARRFSEQDNDSTLS